MLPLDLADPAWLAATVRRHHDVLGLARRPGRVDLVDVRIRNPHLPDSPRCRGWATVRVHEDQVLLLHSPDPGPEARGGTPLPGLALRAWPYPDDPGLPVLAALTDPVRAGGLLPTVCADDRVVDVRVVRWQPGTSATVRCVVEGRRDRQVLYAKALASGDMAAVDAVQRTLRSTAPARLLVAEPVGADVDHRVLWSREVPGRPLLSAFRSGDPGLLDRSAEQSGLALAVLHASEVGPPGRVVDPAEVVAEAAKKARKLATARPEHHDALRRLAAQAARLCAAPREQRPLHGDFHVDQLLLTDRGPVLLDLDEMATGDPALDLAELAVDLVGRPLPPVTTARFLRGFAAGYAHGRPIPARSTVRSYAAAELLNRCYRHLRRPVPGWADALAADVRDADAVLAAVGRMTEGAPA